MSGNKDHLYPVASLSRAQGLKLSRDNSRESLVAHPLLNTSPTSATTPASSSDSPRYVPYTPRHRPPTSATTTATHVQQPAPVTASPLGGATGKLQLQNMKATAQSLGLTSDSVGWAILQKLVDAENGPEWDDVWSTLETSKALLLLPAENLSSQDVIGPEFVKDHIAFCTTVPSQSGTAVTLSGLRAAWEEDTLTFRSTLPTSSKRFTTILRAETSSAGLLALAPIPSTSAYQYPTNTILAYEPKLPLAPQSAHDGKPLLPPRPSARAASASTTGSVSRLSNPFASLFARPGTPGAGASSSTSSGEPHAALEVPALAISRKVVRKEIYKEITIGITSEIKSSLADLPAPVVAKVLAFVAPLYPSPKAPRASAVANGSALPGAIAPPPGSPPDVVSDALQELLASLEHELEQHRTDEKKTYTDDEVRALMDRVESAVCTVFYDHFFRPSESDDASHDEALASRIAALNMLDLSLDHLGVDTTGQTPAVEGVVRTCGDVLQKLGDSRHRSPSTKAGLLVEAHRVIVDGLSKLRPIQLKPEGEPDAADQEKPPAAVASLEPGIEKEMADPGPVPPVTTATPESAPADTGDPDTPAVQALSSVQSDAPAQAHPPPLPPRPHTPPRIPPSPTPTPTPVAGDILLPILIFSVVKANPTQLVSHLLYVQRFRSHSVQGEESYCLVNLMAVVEFLENVDMSALGLGDSQRVMSVSDLTPIPLVHASDASAASQSASARLRGQVGELADSANKVLSGVTGSIGALRGLLPFHTPALGTPAGERSALAEIQDAAPWNAERPGFGMLRRASGFSIASLPGFQKVVRGGGGGGTAGAEEGQQMIEVPSRAASLRGVRGESDGESEGSSQGSGSEDDTDDEGDDHDGNGAVTMDTRSVRSFSSMMSKGSGRASKRLSLSDRLANASKGSPSTLSKTVPLPTIQLQSSDSPARSQSPVPMSISAPRISPPSQRFMTVNEADLRLGEVAELLREYRRVVEGLRTLGGFRDS